jgi:hypothetical protein
MGHRTEYVQTRGKKYCHEWDQARPLTMKLVLTTICYPDKRKTGWGHDLREGIEKRKKKREQGKRRVQLCMGGQNKMMCGAGP